MISSQMFTMQDAVEKRGSEAGVDIDRSLDSLNGGQLTRVRLAAVMFDDPSLVLLDEPTNNLDHSGPSVVRESLTRSRAGTMVVSHDRDLLDGMAAIHSPANQQERIDF